MNGHAECLKTSDTRSRILHHALAVFAEKGFQKSTVAEICKAADANIAAVNYHFQGKANLYAEVLKYAYQETQTAFPSHGNISETAPPEHRLECFVRAMILRAFCPQSAGAFPRFLVHEMTHPTPLMDTVMHDLIHNEINILKTILKPLLPDDIPDERRRFFGINIMAMVMYFSFNRPAREKVMSGKTISTRQVAKLIRHMTLFILFALKSAELPLDVSIPGLPAFSGEASDDPAIASCDRTERSV
ncbi:CerR family C-terminal domain-containing protein [bacterium]|nr:CerR family C-terminal domain-containing protein [candidate division CSSED10-310 bacterium]